MLSGAFGRYSQSLTGWLLLARDRHGDRAEEPELHHSRGLTPVTPARAQMLGYRTPQALHLCYMSLVCVDAAPNCCRCCNRVEWIRVMKHQGDRGASGLCVVPDELGDISG